MADRKVTVLNPVGYQEQPPDSDHLLVAATPTANFHAVNKLKVDQGLANVDLSIESDINTIEGRLDSIGDPQLFKTTLISFKRLMHQL